MAKKLSALQRHMATIKTGEVTKTEVIGIRKAMNAFNLDSERGKESNVSFRELEQISELLWNIRPIVKGDLHDSGVELLQRKRYRRQLESVAEIVADISHFRLIGYHEDGGRVLKAYPVYRCFDHKGKSFPFYVIPWQSNGNGPVVAPSNYW